MPYSSLKLLKHLFTAFHQEQTNQASMASVFRLPPNQTYQAEASMASIYGIRLFRLQNFRLKHFRLQNIGLTGHSSNAVIPNVGPTPHWGAIQ